MFLVNFPLTQTIEANSSLQFSHVFMEVWCWILEISHGFCHRSHHLLLIHRMNTTWLTYSPHLGHRPEPQWFSGCSKSLDDWQNQLEIHGFWLCLFGSLGSSGWSRCFFVLATHSWRLTFRKGGYFQHLSATTWHGFHEESRPKNQGSCSISSGILVTGHWREPEGNPKGKPEGLQKYHHVYHHTILFRVMAVMFFLSRGCTLHPYKKCKNG